MLASITPLGERSRGFRWEVTATAFALGALLAGTAAGAALGLIGRLLPAGLDWRGVALAGVLALALLFDATPLRARLPTSRRQVNEDWLGRYRGTVYGLAFGAQLGVGIATIVTSAAVYAALAAALLAPSVLGGALVGLCFGGVRALSLLPARSAHDPRGLARLHERLARLDTPARRLALIAELTGLAGLIITLLVLA